jgi:hypothetical protein
VWLMSPRMASSSNHAWTPSSVRRWYTCFTCVCVCVCVCERERESVCVCVSVCAYLRQAVVHLLDLIYGAGCRV